MSVHSDLPHRPPTKSGWKWRPAGKSFDHRPTGGLECRSEGHQSTTNTTLALALLFSATVNYKLERPRGGGDGSVGLRVHELMPASLSHLSQVCDQHRNHQHRRGGASAGGVSTTAATVAGHGGRRESAADPVASRSQSYLCRQRHAGSFTVARRPSIAVETDSAPATPA